MSGNPFDPFGGGVAAATPSYGTPGASAYGTPASMNPMPPDHAYGAPQAPQQQQQQYAAMMQHQQVQYPGNQQAYPLQQQQQPVTTPVATDPWGAQPPAYGQQQQAYTQDPWASQPPQQQATQMPQQQQATQMPTSPAASAYDPFAATPAPAQQMVLSQQQSNPYAGVVAQAPAPVQTGYDYGYGSQSLVPSTPQSSQWGVPQNQPPGVQPTAANYDPFAAPAPPPAPVPAPAHQIVPAPTPQVYQENPFGDFLPPAPEPTPPPAPAPPPASAPAPPQEVQIVASPERQLQQYGNYGRRESEPSSRALVPATPRNPYAGELARRAPPGASPLPKAELVKKSGYALSRISFRTIVMKKWKQSYWVQYGSHTMLWFRTQSDFDDWLNNPYHTQAQRNFLIKLAVNFVHDLYKPNVRGYQVTQCRIKPYGNKMVRQFKLERWMDYGPTIAAAFGSYDPKEVDALREAIVECMRNTPLENGVRATGAVRQGQGEGRDYNDHGDSRSRNHERSSAASHQEERNPRYASGAASYTQPTSSSPKVPTAARSVVSTADLLDDHNHFDDTASLPPTSGAALVPVVMPQAYPGAPQQGYYQQGYQQAPPPAQYQQQQQQPYQEYQQYQQSAPQAVAPQQYQQQYQQPAPQAVTQQQYQQQYQQPAPQSVTPQQYQQQYQQAPQQQYGYQQPQAYPGQAPQY